MSSGYGTGEGSEDLSSLGGSLPGGGVPPETSEVSGILKIAHLLAGAGV